MIIAPVLTTSLCINRHDVTRGFGDKHDAIDHQWYGFSAVDHWNLVGPFHLEIGDVAGIDFIEPAVALGVQRAGVHQPVFWFVFGVDQALPGNWGEGGGHHRFKLLFLCHQRRRTDGDQQAA